MGSSRSLCIAAAIGALASCRTATTAPDAGPLYDTARPPYVAPDAPRPRPVGLLEVRLANLIPASPNLTVCLSTIAGTGAPETRGTILGEPDPSIGSDGTLPYPGVSGYLPLPALATPGHAYVLRLYDRRDVPFALAGACPVVGTIPPIVQGTVSPSALGGMGPFSAVALGVLPGTPVACAGGCPPVRLAIFPDDRTAQPAAARTRLVHAIPNLPAPIEVCVDPDMVVSPTTGMVEANGAIPAVRFLPPASDADGLSFGEASPFVSSMPLQTAGAIFVHAIAPGVPSCNAATLLLGPTPIPFPIPPEYPAEVARTIDPGDVITNFAFGRVGTPCTADDMCIAALMGVCQAPRMICRDVLSPNVLPWQDVIGPMSP